MRTSVGDVRERARATRPSSKRLVDRRRRQHQRRALGELLVQLFARERPIRSAAVALVGVLARARRPSVEIDFDGAADLLEAARLDLRVEDRARPSPSSAARARSARTRR